MNEFINGIEIREDSAPDKRQVAAAVTIAGLERLRNIARIEE